MILLLVSISALVMIWSCRVGHTIKELMKGRYEEKLFWPLLGDEIVPSRTASWASF